LGAVCQGMQEVQSSFYSYQRVRSRGAGREIDFRGAWAKGRTVLWAAVLVMACSCGALADGAAFDLAGPPVDVRVRRGEKILPIAEVPNLQPGDRLWVHPDFPDTQSAHYVMIVAFLRGVTNPPPDDWFTKVESWNKKVHEEGVWVNVPQEAQEALVFLAPETGGGFSTLRAAVRGRPGAFVRAAQDLHQASLDRARLEKYLASVRETNMGGGSDQLHEKTVLLARSLNIKLEQECFDKPTAQQVPCLTSNTDQLVLDDAHSQTMLATLTSGAQVDLVAQVGNTSMARSGYYSPYIGAVVDMARILGTMHTAQYQYIPALALPRRDALNLRLNNPPSFRNPKSVIVVGLPPVVPAVLPPLRTPDLKAVYCIGNPEVVLPVEGAPLVFATELAHDLVLELENKAGKTIELPMVADATRGGFVVNTHGAHPADLKDEFVASVHGAWGFQKFDGPTFRFRSPRTAKWVIASKDASALIVGRQDTLHLHSEGACCVSTLTVKGQEGNELPTTWKRTKPDELEIQIQLQDEPAGWVNAAIEQYGLHEADKVPLHTYAEAGRLDHFNVHAGDTEGVLRGTRLDEVTALELNGNRFVSHALSRANQQDELRMVMEKPPGKGLAAGSAEDASVTLKDGRVLPVKAEVDAPRPRAVLMSKAVQLDPNASISAVRLGNPDEVPQDAQLRFSLKAEVPETFSPSEKIEVATADESFRVMLGIGEGNLTLVDSKTLLGVLDPLKHLGPSAFGPLKFRAVSEGVDGDWQPLANLVRVPVLKEVHCMTMPQKEKECVLVGEKLFLVDSVSADPDFTEPTTVPDGFMDSSLPVPAPKGKALYVKLRDDPSMVDTAELPVVVTAAPETSATAR
jgi:hypothetical protein